MTIPKSHGHQYTRREALGLLGTAAGAGLVGTTAGVLPVEAQQRFTSVVSPSFSQGAIIRTVQGDLNPTELANGATLFHTAP